jgi:hypothetical protein
VKIEIPAEHGRRRARLTASRIMLSVRGPVQPSSAQLRTRLQKIAVVEISLKLETVEAISNSHNPQIRRCLR